MIILNGKEIPITVFPDKTTQVWKLSEGFFRSYNGMVTWEFSNEAELLHLAQLKSLLDSKGLESSLYIKYLPYGRQDKPVANDSTFALVSFANLLNALKFKKVLIVDPHSTTALQLIENSTAIFPKKQVEEAITATGANLICYPDKGALFKYRQIYDYPYIYGEKVRDQSTGEIKSYHVMGNAYSANVMIVDDICDFGRTFILLARDLKKAGAKVNLFVTHGLFSGGLDGLKAAGIERIFTQDGEIFNK
jgi:ribose-phosphate pyrophosphokinase